MSLLVFIRHRTPHGCIALFPFLLGYNDMNLAQGNIYCKGKEKFV